MTDNATINRVLAEKVMKWARGRDPKYTHSSNQESYWADGVGNGHICLVGMWKPCENTEDALMVADALNLPYEIIKTSLGNGWFYEARFYNDGDSFIYSQNDRRAMAICLAAYQLVEEK